MLRYSRSRPTSAPSTLAAERLPPVKGSCGPAALLPLPLDPARPDLDQPDLLDRSQGAVVQDLLVLVDAARGRGEHLDDQAGALEERAVAGRLAGQDRVGDVEALILFDLDGDAGLVRDVAGGARVERGPRSPGRRRSMNGFRALPGGQRLAARELVAPPALAPRTPGTRRSSSARRRLAHLRLLLRDL